jgi:hypothetical protein
MFIVYLCSLCENCSENSGPQLRLSLEAVDRGLIQDNVQFTLPQNSQPSPGNELKLA